MNTEIIAVAPANSCFFKISQIHFQRLVGSLRTLQQNPDDGKVFVPNLFIHKIKLILGGRLGQRDHYSSKLSLEILSLENSVPLKILARLRFFDCSNSSKCFLVTILQKFLDFRCT